MSLAITKSHYKIIFIAPADSQPRYHKRASQLLMYCDVEVFAFKRGLYEENVFPFEIPFTSLGWMKPGRYIRRLIRLILAVGKIKKHIKDKKNCLFYALSFDCLLIARLSGIKQGFYEVSDLRQTEGLGKVVPFFEKFLFRNILGLVLTSRFFYEDFYKDKGFIPRDKVLIIDNKVHPVLANQRPTTKKLSEGRIKIGLIGFLRYRKPTELLLKFVQKRPESYIVECFGDGPLSWLVESYMCENIRYYGSFKNPEDLPKIYSKIDLNYVVYDNNNQNVRLLTPNKLFESAFFGVPIVCCKGTAVGRQVIKWNIGNTVRIKSPDLFKKDLDSINRDWLQECSKNCFKLPTSELIDKGETIVRTMLKNIK